ncbi:MAG: HD domain-containing phosphohydrolase [bacterium]
MGKILIADDALIDRELFGSFLAKEGHEISYAETGAQALKQASLTIPDLILLDVVMPDMNGLDACRHLRLDPLLAEIPIILMTGKELHDDRLKGLEAGADDVLFKPVNMHELRARVKNIMRLNRYRKLVQERTTHESTRADREASYVSVLEGWARALELRGIEPEGHIQRVTRMTLRLARALHASEHALLSIRWGVLLHDSGKCGVPDHILKKKDPTEKERETLHKHPEYAYDLFCNTDALQAAIEIPYCHHERWDGSGYPRGLKAEAIPLAARIFAVADAWDILTSEPPCGKGWSKEFARQQIVEQAGKRFDPAVVKAFDAMLTPDDMIALTEPALTTKEAKRAARAESRRTRRHARFSMSSRGAKLHFLSALTLISIIPALAFLYMAMRGFIGSQIGWVTLVPLAITVAALMGLGYGILAKYPASVIRMRHWVEGLAKGNTPMHIELSSDEDDLVAIERCLREVVRQSQQRIRTLEQQTEALLIAERQRVAIEGLGAACHHLGQPATSISIALYMIRRANTSPQVTPLIDQCQQAADAMAEILQKLQYIANYRTEPYLVADESDPAPDIQKILKL